MTTRFRIAIVLITYSFLLLTLVAVGVYRLQSEYSYRDFYKRLETRAKIAAQYNLRLDTRNAASYRAIREQHLERLEQEKEYVLAIPPNSNPDQLATTNQLPVPFIRELIGIGRATAQRGTTFFAGIYVPNVAGKRYVVVVSANNYYINHHLAFLQTILGVGILLSLLLTVFLSIYLAKYVFGPINRITNRIKQIGSDNITMRLARSKQDTVEISELIDTFNGLLGRIETAIIVQKNFVGNASHELATPLTAILGEAEVALRRDRTPVEYKQALTHISTQAERLNDITKALLLLAQASLKREEMDEEELQADELAIEATDIVNKLNAKNQIKIDLHFLPDDPQKLKLRGNKQLVQLALVNILSNACKYSQNKPVSVFIAVVKDGVLFSVVDEGIGIPEAELPYVLDPFYRASNGRAFSGYGIGLPLSKTIIELHGGTLTVLSKEIAGTTVRIRLPNAPI